LVWSDQGLRPWSTILETTIYHTWDHDLPYLRPWSTILETMIYHTWDHDLPYLRPWSTILETTIYHTWDHDLLYLRPRSTILETMIYRTRDHDLPYLRPQSTVLDASKITIIQPKWLVKKEWASDGCLTPTQQFFSHIMASEERNTTDKVEMFYLKFK
jgi:hypothetical protein